ncbi:nitrilase-related carbon-nitrogen hydrolase [Ramlibacter alkalitolerans]|uniref:CN hydrolase domain-containing protein n=1 Tax=Ramlibacter alkalitolerans TaxID=2039631 RepID=A0ABS1JU55_9BURK|nr:nitrilase-related carbon-nitrogen hydrolase [Ramlibacter alkalitolerans]MBL0427834.1 hypothetical protein [Ramlibacter alkalitolerans]
MTTPAFTHTKPHSGAYATLRTGTYAGAHVLAPFVLAISAGLSWGDSPAHLVGAMLVFLAFGLSTCRLQAFAAVMTYYLVTARGVPAGGALFFSDATKPTLIWLAVSALLAAVWALAWTKNWKQFCWRLPLAQVVLIVPPVGMLAVGNPLTAAGMLFPGWGFAGVAAALAAGVLLAQYGSARGTHKLAHRFGLTVMAGMLLALLTYGPTFQPQAPGTMSSVDTHVGNILGRNAFEQLPLHQANTERAAELLEKGKQVVVFPETAAGEWTPMREELWGDVSALARERNAVVITGATTLRGKLLDNSLVLLGGEQPQVYRVRVPVPFRDRGRQDDLQDSGSNVFGQSVYATKAGRVGVFICYEVLLPWTVLATAFEGADVFVAGVNGWWAPEGNSIPGLQRSAIQSWAQLFGVPAVVATNR